MTQGTNGTVTFTASSVTYTPAANYNGTDSYTYTITDNGTTNGVADPKTSTATVNVTITEVNDSPTAVNDTATVAEDGSVTFDPRTNDSRGPANESTQTLSVTAVTQGTNGTVTFTAAERRTRYTPAANYNGPDSFTYTITDNGTTNGVADPKTSTATVNVTITNVNDTPVAVNDTATVAEDGTVTTSVLANDSRGPANESGQTLTVTAVTQGANGTVTTNGTTMTYTPNANYNGPDTYTYTITDNGTTNGVADPKTGTATVNVTVTPVNDAPTANSQAVTTNEDTAKVITLSGADIDSAALTFSIVTGPAHGTLSAITGTTCTPAGAGTTCTASVTYTPFTNYNGPDIFTFKVSDGTLNSTPATVSITVNSVDDAPSGANKTITTLEDTAYTFTTSDFGFTDPNDSPANSLAAVKITTLPASGTLKLSGVAVTAGQSISAADISAGNLTLSPAANANGPPYTSFTFQVQDNGGTANGGVDLDQSPNTITINVTPVNDAPVANPDSYTTPQSTPLTVAAPGVLGNDTDVDSSTITAVLVTNVAHGTLLLNSDGSFSYTPTNAYSGSDSFTYKAYDGYVYSNIATVTITVTPSSYIWRFLAPLDESNGPTIIANSANYGRVIPVKGQIYNGTTLLTSAQMAEGRLTLRVIKLSDCSYTAVDTVEEYVQAAGSSGTSNIFRWSGSQLIFNLDTSAWMMSVGSCYRLDVYLDTTVRVSSNPYYAIVKIVK